MLKKPCLLLACCLLFTSLAFAAHVPGEVVVKFKPGMIKAAAVAASSVRALNAKYGVTKIEQIYKDALEIRPDWKHLEDDYLMTISTGKEVLEAVREYKKDPNVVNAAPNTIVRAFVNPNDTYYDLQWGLAKIKAPEGWDKTTGNATAEIAILDTGLNYNHEDFVGKVDLANAKDYVNNDDDPMDDFGHGTGVAGAAAAVTNNAKGVAGMDWQANILPIKVLDHIGEGTITNINKGLAWVAALKSTGTNIVAINMSFGQYSPESNLEARCSDAYNEDIVLVAAAGNDNVDWNTYPAYYPTVIAVAATDSLDKRSVWSDPLASNYGNWVDVSAPGSNIWSANNDGGYRYWNGTSLASPYVAGLAALIRAANGSMTNAQIAERIRTTTDNIDAQNPGFVGKLGTGRINSYNALTGLTAAISSPASGEYIKAAKQVYGTAAGWNFGSYRLEAWNNGEVLTIESSTVPVENGRLGTWYTSALNGNYTIRLKVFSAGGSSAEASVSVIVDNLPPDVAITAPANGATVEGRVAIIGRAKDLYFDRYILEYGKGASPSTFQNIGTYYASVDAGALGTWEVAGLEGDYALRLTAYDKVGLAATASIVVNILEVPPTKEVQPQAGLPLTFALPNPFDRASTSETALFYKLEGNFDTSIFLFDLNGNLVWRRNYAAGENGGKAGTNDPPWNGQNLYGESVPNGVYLYQVTADRRVIARGKIIVLN